MAERLPTPGGDSGTWGDVLNAFLGVAHNSDGTLKTDGNGAHYLDGTGAWSTPSVGSVAESAVTFTNITTNNATTVQHGFLPKLDGSATKVLLGDGTWGLAAAYAANAQTGNYTLVAGDAGKIVEMNVASACTVTIPTNASVAFPVGTSIALFQVGAGQVTVAVASGATVISASSKVKLTGQYSSGAIRKRATDQWVLAGDIA